MLHITLQELEVLARFIAEALKLHVLKARRYHKGLVSLKPALAHAYLARMVVQLRDEVVVDERIAERLKTMRRLQHEPCALGRIPPVEIWIAAHLPLPQHFLYFLPEPHGQRSLRPTFGSSLTMGVSPTSSPSLNFHPSASRTNCETSWWLQNSPFAV